MNYERWIAANMDELLELGRANRAQELKEMMWGCWQASRDYVFTAPVSLAEYGVVNNVPESDNRRDFEKWYELNVDELLHAIKSDYMTNVDDMLWNCWTRAVVSISEVYKSLYQFN